MNFSEKYKKDADSKQLYYVKGGTQEWKFNFVKIFFPLCINGGTGKIRLEKQFIFSSPQIKKSSSFFPLH